ncbi:PRD domain-containing protein [Corynebacterium endometrii]|uniref:PtsGHI operon antiterminator n=1 Tax=Corynebacterium endometrii TaxID=2488819 RepID=A0A4P7QF09_9CORY|nr:PRD domain-containing protein [Corynebacterium endometrii]QCB27476.1 PtsGHI operon antiterminator [Corynebacterium endometrii]
MSTDYRVTRVISNNAVFVQSTAHPDQEEILVGRGVGFGVKAGEMLKDASQARSFIPKGKEKSQLLKALERIDDDLFAAVTAGLEKAMDYLGALDPSAYLLLAEHISFAVQRVRRGEIIHNPLLEEIHAAFTEEFDAALMVLAEVNDSLGVHLPVEEAAYIALHLNAARTGSTVKAPLATANALAGDMAIVRNALGIAPSISQHSISAQRLASALIELRTHIAAGRRRSNAMARSVERELPREFGAASEVICSVVETPSLPHSLRGEAAFFAMFLHGWKQ